MLLNMLLIICITLFAKHNGLFSQTGNMRHPENFAYLQLTNAD
jgi:hypothetical protein